MTERDNIRKSIKTIFIHNLKAAQSVAEVPDEHKGAFAAVLTMADYIHSVSPILLQTNPFLELAQDSEKSDKNQLHPVKFLGCSCPLEGCLREIEAENLEDIESCEIVGGGIVGSVEYYYFWVNGHKRCASSMPRYILTELQNVYKGVLGRDMPLHSADAPA